MSTHAGLAENIYRRLGSRKEFTGDKTRLQADIAATEATEDATDLVVQVAFMPVDHKGFEEAARKALAGAAHTVSIATGGSASGGSAQYRVTLYKNLPCGVATLPCSLFERLLDAGLVKEFSWTPEIHLADAADVTPLSCAATPAQDRTLRDAGISSALDFASKMSLPGMPRQLASATGMSESELVGLAATCRTRLTPKERTLLDTPDTRKFVSGVPLRPANEKHTH